MTRRALVLSCILGGALLAPLALNGSDARQGVSQASPTPGDSSAVELCVAAGRDAADAVIVITDLEPDDRWAIHLLARHLSGDELAVVGATLLDTPLKAALLRRLLDQLERSEVTVAQGTGLQAEDYPRTRSSSAARSFRHEGVGILSATQLEELAGKRRASDQLRTAIRDTLSRHANVDIALLAPSDDLAAVLRDQPELAESVRCLHMVGGWLPREGDGLRATYNWNMSPRATAYLLALRELPIVLYSSHALRRSFGGVSINRDNSPRLWRSIAANAVGSQGVFDTIVASAAWDTHIVATYPPIRDALETHAGRNFSPADPTAAIGLIDPRILRSYRLMTVELDVDNLQESSGFAVHAELDDDGHVALIESFDVDLFRERMLDAVSR